MKCVNFLFQHHRFLPQSTSQKHGEALIISTFATRGTFTYSATWLFSSSKPPQEFSLGLSPFPLSGTCCELRWFVQTIAAAQLSHSKLLRPGNFSWCLSPGLWWKVCVWLMTEVESACGLHPWHRTEKEHLLCHGFLQGVGTIGWLWAHPPLQLRGALAACCGPMPSLSQSRLKAKASQTCVVGDTRAFSPYCGWVLPPK